MVNDASVSDGCDDPIMNEKVRIMILSHQLWNNLGTIISQMNGYFRFLQSQQIFFFFQQNFLTLGD